MAKRMDGDFGMPADDDRAAFICSSYYQDLSQNTSITVWPEEFGCFFVHPAKGAEWMTIGLARYPKIVENRGDRIKVSRRGWSWGDFCKTQYANHPDYGGIKNFLRAHISLITLLEQVKKIEGFYALEIDDEGHYGPAYYTDDPTAAEPIYTWHPGQYSPKELVKEIGEWDAMIAAAMGAINDHAKTQGQVGSCPIMDRPDFEHLEAEGHKIVHVKKFLNALAEAPQK
jgi:hypothetical protein